MQNHLIIMSENTADGDKTLKQNKLGPWDDIIW